MSHPDFPTRLIDLTLNDSTHHPSLYATLKSIRKSTLSIPNRLTSILSDAEFVKSVSRQYNLPLVANERCGSWYIDPSYKSGSTYFKSTDGHHGQWDFSPRRLNLQLLPILAAHGGAIVVDSTRRGKNLPDAFSKTVPIWTAVINKVLFPEISSAHRLQTPPPPDDLGPSEISQIEARLEDFTRNFTRLELDLESLRKELKRPVRLTWAINGYSGVEHVDEADLPSLGTESAFGHSSHNLVLCSASRRVRGAESSEGGELLMETPEDALPALIEELLDKDNEARATGIFAARILPTCNLYIAVGPLESSDGFDLIINCQGDARGSKSKVLWISCRNGKLGSKDLREKLPGVISVISNQLSTRPQSKILITCTTGKDLSVGVAVAILCLCYDDEGHLREVADQVLVEKQLVRRRLAWITCSKQDANPSRATLQAVNSFLMQRPD
ncbi:initiator tRNA phosphoribosyl transferase [Fonsecaea erecta]|uniref:Initiator tRNA phosphoribosyl transferase n=1 Tax=Fonsecaea erecta TaxID=1367422 RepID=A0A178ZMS7_9EURO|nr:initiator tRNA phosphoribosyl transferase [Fonsecaea erecta]OAP61097.1 initiator tRNA phosphoribosyl transferase [Fonsecaea erecta]